MLIVYLLNLGFILLVMTGLWTLSIPRRDPSFIDSVWPLGFVLLAVSSALLAGWPLFGSSLVLPLVTLWGLRLATHLFLRWRKEGLDRRYADLMAKAPGGRVHLFNLVAVFLLQGSLLWLVALPVQHAVMEGARPLTGLAWAAIGLFALGFLFETIGDWQLARFKADPANKGQVMDRGLWRYTRHPNYFGDACVFWGLWLIAVSDGTGWWTAIGPAFLTWTLVKWSGAALLEKNLHESRPGYADYVRRTSGFIPWFPKRD